MAENMLLRSVYLPPDFDSRLKKAAYEHNTTKNELIRQFVEKGLEDFEAQDNGMEPVRALRP